MPRGRPMQPRRRCTRHAAITFGRVRARERKVPLPEGGRRGQGGALVSRPRSSGLQPKRCWLQFPSKSAANAAPCHSRLPSRSTPEGRGAWRRGRPTQSPLSLTIDHEVSGKSVRRQPVIGNEARPRLRGARILATIPPPAHPPLREAAPTSEFDILNVTGGNRLENTRLPEEMRSLDQDRLLRNG